MEAVQCSPVNLEHVELVKPDEDSVMLTGQHVQTSAPKASQEIEKMARTDSSNDRKRKIECCGAILPDSLPLKKRNATPSRGNTEFKPGHFQCTCTEWIPLKDINDLTLELWNTHLSVCSYAKTKGITSLEEMINSSDDPALHGLKSFLVTDEVPLTLKHDEDCKLSYGTTEVKLKLKPNATVPPNCNATHGSLAGSVTAEKSILCESVAGSPRPSARRRKVRGPNRTEAERIEAFRSDPQVKEIEPYRVLCATCNRWIKLRNNSRYCSIPWNCHKNSCNENREIARAKSIEKRKATKSASPRAMQKPLTRNADDAELTLPLPDVSPPDTKVDPTVPPPNVYSSLQPQDLPGSLPEASSSEAEVSTIPVPIKHKKELKVPKEPRRQRETDADIRRAALESDPYASSVEPDRLICGLCKRWVKLRPNSSYCAAPWQSHIQRCVTRAFKLEPEGDWKLKIEESAFLPPEFMAALTLKYSKTAGVKGITEKTGEDNAEGHRLSDDPQSEREQSDGLSTKLLSNRKHQTREVIKKRRGRPPKHLALPKRQESVPLTDVSYESEEN